MLYWDICIRVVADDTAPKRRRDISEHSGAVMCAGYIMASCLTPRADVRLFDWDMIGWGVKCVVLVPPDGNMLYGLTTSVPSALVELSWSANICICYYPY